MFQNFASFQRQFAELGQQLLTTDGNDSDDSDLDGLDTGGLAVTFSRKRASESDKPVAQSSLNEPSDQLASSSAGRPAEVRVCMAWPASFRCMLCTGDAAQYGSGCWQADA
jgi:hypothetical protein